MVDDLVDLQSHGLARPHVVDFAEPAIDDCWVGDFGHDAVWDALVESDVEECCCWFEEEVFGKLSEHVKLFL